jgi:hypothetical protein
MHISWLRGSIEEVFTGKPGNSALTPLYPLLTPPIRSSLSRFRVQLASDTKTINKKLYLAIQEQIDEIGRMLGGWLKTLK